MIGVAEEPRPRRPPAPYPEKLTRAQWCAAQIEPTVQILFRTDFGTVGSEDVLPVVLELSVPGAADGIILSTAEAVEIAERLGAVMDANGVLLDAMDRRKGKA